MLRDKGTACTVLGWGQRWVAGIGNLECDWGRERRQVEVVKAGGHPVEPCRPFGEVGKSSQNCTKGFSAVVSVG